MSGWTFPDVSSEIICNWVLSSFSGRIWQSWHIIAFCSSPPSQHFPGFGWVNPCPLLFQIDLPDISIRSLRLCGHCHFISVAAERQVWKIKRNTQKIIYSEVALKMTKGGYEMVMFHQQEKPRSNKSSLIFRRWNCKHYTDDTQGTWNKFPSKKNPKNCNTTWWMPPKVGISQHQYLDGEEGSNKGKWTDFTVSHFLKSA